MLQRYKEVNLAVNWGKCQFMVQERVVLRHVVSNRGIEVDRVKIEVIERLVPPPIGKSVEFPWLCGILLPLYQGFL